MFAACSGRELPVLILRANVPAVKLFPVDVSESLKYAYVPVPVASKTKLTTISDIDIRFMLHHPLVKEKAKTILRFLSQLFYRLIRTNLYLEHNTIVLHGIIYTRIK